MPSFSNIRVLSSMLGFALLAYAIWHAAAFFGYPVWVRILVIGLLVAGWVAWKIARRVRASRASKRIFAAVAEQAQAGPANANIEELRERFQQAVAILQRRRRGSHAIYELPWYVVVGPPGSGKSTAIRHSGLKFPADQRADRRDRGELPGFGGTRNCKWWFTDHAILIDTAGRYFTQDSDPNDDSASWKEFLGLLRKYRKRRPLNGVILTIDARDLSAARDAEWDRRVRAARRRLDELYNELRIDLPIYLVITKCDLMAGFVDYFDDFDHQARAQVWGITFPIEQTRDGKAADAFPEQFDALVSRLGERMLHRVNESKLDVQRRVRIFTFPQQVASLREPLHDYVDAVFGSTRHERRVLLRGVYLTSGTQEGTTIDRLLGELHRQLGIGADSGGVPPASPAKVYFIERLLKDVIFQEAGLAGVNWRLEWQKAAWQFGGLVAIVAVGLVAIILLSQSYLANRADLEVENAEVARLESLGAVSVQGETSAVLARLQALSSLDDHVGRGWWRHFGLYQGSEISAAAQDAYTRGVNRSLLPHVMGRLERALRSAPVSGNDEASIVRLYRYLKAYLLLGTREYGQPEEIDEDYLVAFADAEWGAARADDEEAPALASHFKQLVTNRALRQVPLDATLVAQVRNTVRYASLPALMYGELKLQAENSEARLKLNEAAGVGAEQWLKRRSGVPLSAPIPNVYTGTAFLRNAAVIFADTANAKRDGIVSQFADGWVVWGQEKRASNSRQLAVDLINYYEDDYIKFWDRIAHDIVPASASAVNLTRVLAGPASPLRGLVKTIDQHTYLKPPEQTDKPAAGWTWDGLLKYLPAGVSDSVIGEVRARVGAVPPDVGMRVTQHFAAVHRLVVEPASLEEILQQLQQVGVRLDGMNKPGSSRESDTAANNEIQSIAATLKVSASALPEPASNVVAQTATAAAGEALGKTGRQLPQAYQQLVVSACRRVVQSGRYPFDRASRTDVALSEFAEIFGQNGAYQRFVDEYLTQFVEKGTHPWSVKPGSPIGAGSPLVSKPFEVSQIREAFFRQGPDPALGFSVALVELTAPQFVLSVDGQGGLGDKPDNFHPMKGSPPPATRRWSWPGPQPGNTWYGFPPTRMPDYSGPWSFFRLLEDLRSRGAVQPANGGGYDLTLQSSRGAGDLARVRVVPDRDPFAALDMLRRFGC